MDLRLALIEITAQLSGRGLPQCDERVFCYCLKGHRYSFKDTFHCLSRLLSQGWHHSGAAYDGAGSHSELHVSPDSSLSCPPFS